MRGKRNTDKDQLLPRSAKGEAGLQAASALEADLRKRLKHAAGIIERLNKTARLPKKDRRIFASNLGYMYSRIVQTNETLHLSDLFQKAFGTEIGESHYKKRKRYIRLKDDDEKNSAWDESLAAAGRDYLSLAEAIDSFAQKSPGLTEDESVQLYVLRLVEASSFDDRRGMKERGDIEQREEIQRRLSQITERVTSRVDLDWLRMWSQQHPIGIRGSNGKMEEVSLVSDHGWGPRLDIHKNIYENFDGECDNRIAPCIRLGHVLSKPKLDGVVILEVPRQITDEPAIEQYLYHILRQKLGVPDDGDDVWELPELNTLKDWVGRDEFSALEWGQSPDFYFGRSLDLELRFDPGVDRWRLCILLRVERDGGFYLCPGKSFFSLGFTSKRPLQCFQLGIVEATGEFIYAIELGADEEDKSDIFACFSKEELDFVDESPDVQGIKEGCLIITTQEAGDLLLASLKDKAYEASFDIDICDDKFAPVNHDSLAGAILRNLAYAEDGRIDNLLIRDARRRYEMIRKLKRESEKDYQTHITKLDL